MLPLKKKKTLKNKSRLFPDCAQSKEKVTKGWLEKQLFL